MDSVWQEDHFVIFYVALHTELPWMWACEGILHLTLWVQSQENNLRTRTCTQSDSPSLRVLSWAHSSAFYLSPSAPVLPLFPGCTPTCPGLASREFSLAGGMFSELRFSSSSLLFFVFSGFFRLYRYWLITGTFSCQQYTAAAVEHLLTSRLLLSAHSLISGREWRGGRQGLGTDVY